MSTQKTPDTAINRVTFLRWWKVDGGFGCMQAGDLQVVYTGLTGESVKPDVNVPVTDEGRALVESIAAINGLSLIVDDERELEYQVGPETPYLHGWIGYTDTEEGS